MCKYSTGQGLSQQSSQSWPFAAKPLAGTAGVAAVGMTSCLEALLELALKEWPPCVETGGVVSAAVGFCGHGLLHPGLVHDLPSPASPLEPHCQLSGSGGMVVRMSGRLMQQRPGPICVCLGSPLLAWNHTGVLARTGGGEVRCQQSIGTAVQSLRSGRFSCAFEGI